MKKIHLYLLSSLLCILTAGTGYAQNNPGYQAASASVDIISGDVHKVRELPPAILTLSDGTGQMDLKITSSFFPDEDPPLQKSLAQQELSGMELRLNINYNQLHSEVRSETFFVVQGVVTINGISKEIPVQYSILLSNSDQPRKYGISLTAGIKAADFNIPSKNPNTLYLVRVTDGMINRI